MADVITLPGAKAPAGYRMTARGPKKAEVFLYGVIGESFFGDGVSANQFAKDLRGLGAIETLDVRINSEGGDVFDGKAIYSLLAEHPAEVTVYIDGLAASAASYIAMAGNEIVIAEGAFVMIHEARGGMWGTAGEHRRLADTIETVNASLAQTYVDRTGNTAAQVAAWMAEETWFTAAEALQHGFADRVAANQQKVAAQVTRPTAYRHLPAALRPKRAAAVARMAELAARHQP